MIVFDLDGTIALDDHRVHHLRKEPKDWDAYFAACREDIVNQPIAAVLKALHNQGTHTLGLWTGRSAKVKHLTDYWLEYNGIGIYFDQFRMRAPDDRTDDLILKAQWMQEQALTGDPVTLVFEDRQRVVDMWRSHGIVCCQVAPGAF